jgi:hypothetical protein
MKKIIDKKMFNTETAKLVAHYNNGYSVNDFKHLSEHLYRTKNGNWFLHGDGGAMTRYSVSCGDMQAGGEDIIPISEEEAYEWLERNSETEKIKEFFNIEEA